MAVHSSHDQQAAWAAVAHSCLVLDWLLAAGLVVDWMLHSQSQIQAGPSSLNHSSMVEEVAGSAEFGRPVQTIIEVAVPLSHSHITALIHSWSRRRIQSNCLTLSVC